MVDGSDGIGDGDRPLASYDGPARLLTWRDDAKDGPTVDLLMGVPGPDGGHPFRTMGTGRETGQRLAVSCVRTRGNAAVDVYVGEAVLMRWSENDRTGMMARLLLDDGPDGPGGAHPFKGLVVGRKAGEPIELRAFAIADDETVAPPSSRGRRTPFHLLDAVTQSQIYCRDPRFSAFLRRNVERFVQDEAARASVLAMEDRPDGFPAAVLRIALNVASRAIMNQRTADGERARKRWARIVDLYVDEVHGYSSLAR